MSSGCDKELKQLQKKYLKLKFDYEILLKECKYSTDKYKSIFDQLPHLAIQGYNTKREVVYWNNGSTRLYGYDSHEALGQKLEDLIIPETIKSKVICNIENWVKNDQYIPACELTLKHKDGSAVAVLSQHVMVKLPDNEKELYCLDIDLRELKEKESLLQEAKRQAITDGLTTLYNRLFYMQMAELEIKLAIRDGKYLVFAMFDMDHFKKFNDTYGHKQGDELLKAFAKILKNHCCRPNDYPFRIGGEEFLIIYSADSPDRAADLAKRVFDAFLHMKIPHKNNAQYDTATLSVGIAIASPENKMTAEQLYHYADQAMYKAKQNGRNQYIVSCH